MAVENNSVQSGVGSRDVATADYVLDYGRKGVMMPAGNRNRLASATSTTTANDRTFAVTYWTAKSNGYTDIEAEFQNFTYQGNGAPLSSTLPVMEIRKVAIEYPIGGTITPMYLSNYNGVDQPQTARDQILQPGDYARWKVAIKIPRNAQYRIRFYRFLQGAGPNYNFILNALTHSGKNDGYAAGDVADSGALTLYVAATQIFTPTLVKGTSDVADVPRVVFIGDSIMQGSGVTSDPWAETVQGDWISNSFQGIFPYENKSNNAWIELGLNNELPYLNLGIASAQSVSFTLANRAAEIRMMQEINPTHIILGLVINDLLTGTTGANCITRITNNIILLRSYFPRAIIWMCTPVPVSNSTDAYATLVNQSLSGTLAAGGTPSDWALFTDNAGATGRSLVLKEIRANKVNADGIIDISAWLSHPTDERYWNSLYGIFTGDGIHPNNPGHHRGREAIDLPSLFGVFPLTVNTRKTQATGTVYLGNLDKLVHVSTVSAVATIYLPRVPLLGQSHVISDIGGNSLTNNITVNDADAALISTINVNSSSKTFVYAAGLTAHKWMVY